MSRATLTQERLHQLLDYDPMTGVFTNKTTRGGVLAGDTAGARHSDGYVQITIDGKKYYAHRIAWLYTYGIMPAEQIDHISGQRNDNSIGNLRAVTSQQNNMNARIRSDNRSGIKGVRWCKRDEKWVARIKVFNKEYNLGLFDTIEEAAAARQGAAALAFGDFRHQHDKEQHQ